MTEIPIDKTTEPNGSNVKTNGALPQHSRDTLTESCATRADHGDTASDVTPSNGVVVHPNETAAVAAAFPDGDATQGELPNGYVSVATDTAAMISDAAPTDESTGDGDPSKSVADYDIEALLYEAGWENRAGSIPPNAPSSRSQDIRNSTPQNTKNQDAKAKNQGVKARGSSTNAAARDTAPLVSPTKNVKKMTIPSAQAQSGVAKKSGN